MPLALETGRFGSDPEDDRRCSLGDVGKSESEVHFLFYGPLYLSLRNDVFAKILDVYPDVLFVFLNLTDEDKMHYLSVLSFS